MSDNLPSSVSLLSGIIFSNQIVEMHLFRCDREISLNFPSLSRLVLVDSLDVLNNLTSLINIQSIQIALHYQFLCFGNDNWAVLRVLSTLPRLASLRVVLYNMRTPPNDANCQIIVETIPFISDFSFCFRRTNKDRSDYNVHIAHIKHSLFIQQLQNRILALPLVKQPYVLIEEDGYGIIVWF